MSAWIKAVWVLCLIVWPSHADEHDHDHPSKPAPRPSGGNRSAEVSEGCAASPNSLANFANAEKYDFSSVVAFITHPSCAAVHSQISQAAIDQGVKFISSGPFRLDQYAKNRSGGPSGTVTAVDQTLGRIIPPLLSENPLSSAEMLPLLGQLSILSPTAARSTLTTLIRQETEAADRKLASASPSLKPAIAGDLAISLLKMGILDPVVASDLSESVEDLALTVQADSLGKFFRGLAAAVTADTSLAPAFNLSATALNRGIRKGKDQQTKDQQARLLQAVFEAVRASVNGSGLMEPGTVELNEAVAALAQGQPLSVTSLRKLWKETTRILTQSSSQVALAESVAASLTPQMVFLRADMRDQLLMAAANYPLLARAVQQNFVDAWSKAWGKMSASQMSLADFNRLKSTYFEMFIPKMLDFPSESLDVRWIRAAYHWGLVKDVDIEKKFPRLFLSQLDRRDQAIKSAAKEQTVNADLQALSESLAVVFALHQAHLPILNRWVKRNEEPK